MPGRSPTRAGAPGGVGRRATLALLAAAAGAWACADVPSAGDPDVVPRHRLEGPQVRIGSVDDPAFAFGPVLAAVEGPDGRLYSLHRGEGAVRVWDAEGRPAGTVGRQGEGPGEFRFPTALGFFGDSLWVMDGANRRVSYFERDGTLLGSRVPSMAARPREISGEGPPNPWRPRRDGTWWGRGAAPYSAVASGDVTTLTHVGMTAEGTVLDTAWIQDLRPTDVLAVQRGERTLILPQPWNDGDVVAFAPDGSLVAVERRATGADAAAAAVRVRWITATGDTLAEASLPYEPRPLTDGVVDSMLTARARAIHDAMPGGGGMGLAELERGLRDGIHPPPSLPAVDGEPALAHDGALWLRSTPDGEEAARWWVVGPEEGLRAEVVAPPGLRVLDVRGRTVWGVERDDLDVDYLVRYRVVPEEEGGAS